MSFNRRDDENSRQPAPELNLCWPLIISDPPPQKKKKKKKMREKKKRIKNIEILMPDIEVVVPKRTRRKGVEELMKSSCSTASPIGLYKVGKRCSRSSVKRDSTLLYIRFCKLHAIQTDTRGCNNPIGRIFLPQYRQTDRSVTIVLK